MEFPRTRTEDWIESLGATYEEAIQALSDPDKLTELDALSRLTKTDRYLQPILTRVKDAILNQHIPYMTPRQRKDQQPQTSWFAVEYGEVRTDEKGYCWLCDRWTDPKRKETLDTHRERHLRSILEGLAEDAQNKT